jgi:hypothetical protein
VKRSRALWIVLVTAGMAAVTPRFLPAQDDAKSAATPEAKPEARTILRVAPKAEEGKDAPLTVLLDITEAPDAKDWALKAADYAIEWYPKLCEVLASEGFEPVKEVTLLFKPMNGVAHASRSTITISSKWIEQHPDDLGMVAHELVHVVQRYRHRAGPGWLTEGIADYVRYYVVEPGSKRARFDRQKSNYKTGYQPTAGWLNWIEQRRPGTVTKLNTALRDGKYTPDLFKELAGGDPDALWDEFKASPESPK